MRRIILSLALILALATPAFADEAVVGDPFPLANCALTGKALTADAVVVVKDGREYKFCCNGCKGKLEADSAAVISKVDAAIIEQQKAKYPLDTCIMAGEKLGEKSVDAVFNNRLVRFCCKDCAAHFKEDVAGNMKKLDAAVIEKQKATLTAKTCPVSGEELGSMGDPVNIVIANQTFALCCKGCEKGLRKDPAKFLAMAQDGAKETKKQ
ncbi:MAG: hypothetical protein SGI88_03695 [Candidatus Hydrogenedentes bacterium]|nr:hypothetical protein [Candidatus Hydrogenedentota bacterium]